MVKKLVFSLLMLFSSTMGFAGQLYVSVSTGNDINPGTEAQPIKTLAEAARRVNLSYKKEAVTIVLAAGVYPLTETVFFNNQRFTAENRLVIRAQLMPDDAAWTPQQMPILASVIPGIITPGQGNEARGLQIETSHVTIAGLRFTGGLEYYYIDGKQSRRYYPIWRDGKNLDDLVVTQCLFAGNTDLSAIRVAVIANGHGLTLDHCVFYNCENSVVFGEAEGGTSSRNVMRYCLAYGPYYSGIWTTKETGSDLEFHHNILANGRTGWITDKNEKVYTAHDCIITGNTVIGKYGNDAGMGSGATVKDFLTTTDVEFKGVIEIEKDQSKNNYLQLKEGSVGTELKAGLFKK